MAASEDGGGGVAVAGAGGQARLEAEGREDKEQIDALAQACDQALLKVAASCSPEAFSPAPQHERLQHQRAVLASVPPHQRLWVRRGRRGRAGLRALHLHPIRRRRRIGILAGHMGPADAPPGRHAPPLGPARTGALAAHTEGEEGACGALDPARTGGVDASGGRRLGTYWPLMRDGRKRRRVCGSTRRGALHVSSRPRPISHARVPRISHARVPRRRVLRRAARRAAGEGRWSGPRWILRGGLRTASGERACGSSRRDSAVKADRYPSRLHLLALLPWRSYESGNSPSSYMSDCPPSSLPRPPLAPC